MNKNIASFFFFYRSAHSSKLCVSVNQQAVNVGPVPAACCAGAAETAAAPPSKSQSCTQHIVWWWAARHHGSVYLLSLSLKGLACQSLSLHCSLQDRCTPPPPPFLLLFCTLTSHPPQYPRESELLWFSETKQWLYREKISGFVCFLLNLQGLLLFHLERFDRWYSVLWHSEWKHSCDIVWVES